jgi:hypothetical protein
MRVHDLYHDSIEVMDENTFYRRLFYNFYTLAFIGHNSNDTFLDYSYNDVILSKVQFIVYDDYERVVSKQEMKDKLEVYTPKESSIFYYPYKPKVFTFRYDPVPKLMRNMNYVFRYYRKSHSYKSVYLEMAKYPEFHRRKLLSKAKYNVTSWRDDHPRSLEKSWKSHRKHQYKSL